MLVSRGVLLDRRQSAPKALPTRKVTKRIHSRLARFFERKSLKASVAMKILEFADLDTSRVKPAYRKVAAAIAKCFRAAQVGKRAVAGFSKLYLARLNDADRLIFCLLRQNDDVCTLMLEVIVNHD
jgi:hypothetical protein